MNKKTILYLRTEITPISKAGGSIAHGKGIVDAMERKSHKVIIMAAQFLPGLETKKYLLIPPFFLKWLIWGIGIYLYNLYAISVAKNKFKTIKPDLIYCRYASLSDLPIRLAKLYKVPLILEYNGSEVWIAKNWNVRFFSLKMVEKIEKECLNEAIIIVVVSDALKQELIRRGISPEKILINPNGVDIELYNLNKCRKDVSRIKKQYNLDKIKLIAGYIGTFGPWHGVDKIVYLAKKLKEIEKMKTNDIKFFLVGDGAEILKVKKLISKFQLEEYFVFTGLVPQNKGISYISTFDISLNPTVPNKDGSEFFGSPTKLFEYMALQKAIVSSNIGQMGQILRNGRTALLYDPNNQDGLYYAFKKLLNDKKLINKLGANARQDVKKHYTWDKNINKVFELLAKKNDK